MKLITTSLAAIALVALAGCNRGAANNTAGNAAAPAANGAEANAAKPAEAPAEENAAAPEGNAAGGETPAAAPKGRREEATPPRRGR